jgi:aspartate-semialdehyde dehydrogenase
VGPWHDGGRLPTRRASRVAFSGLDAEVAGGIEEEFARAGLAVVSNARNHRLESDVPLLVPEVNHDHLALVEVQKRRFAGGGFIVTNPNCSTVGLVMALAPLHAAYEVTEVVVATLQAVSGAGYPGVASLDILGNVIPHIGGEEEKMEAESRKILGRPGTPAAFAVSAHCHRVPVADGHTLAISLRTRRAATPEQARGRWRATPLAARGPRAAEPARAADRRARRTGPAAAAPRRPRGWRHERQRRPGAALPDSRPQAGRPGPQHHPRRRGRGAAQRRAPQIAGPSLR